MALNQRVLGERIRIARERKGLSQHSLANFVSKDQKAISLIESGERRIAASELPDFAEALDVSILYFFEGELRREDLDVAMLQVFQQISTPEVKQSAIEIVRILSETPTLST